MRKNHSLANLAASCVAVALLSMPVGMQSCADVSDEEAGGRECLAQARALLADSNFSGARAAIDTLRAKYPMAFNAREEGILLLDSIDLASARRDLQKANAACGENPGFVPDSIQFLREEASQKIKFFTKKLEHDKANFKKH